MMVNTVFFISMVILCCISTPLIMYDYIFYLGLISVFVGPLIVYFLWSTFKGRSNFVIGLCAITFIVSTAIIRERDFLDKTIDLQIIIRLSALTCMLLISIRFYKRSRLILLSPSLQLWITYLLFGMVTVVYSPSPLLNFVSASSVMIALTTLVVIAEECGIDRVAEIFVFSSAFLCIVSLPVYFLLPHLGQTSIYQGNSLVLSGRLRGITQTPEIIASVALLGLTIGYSYFNHLRKLARYVLIINVPFALLCAYLSNGRMSIAAFFVSLISFTVRSSNTAIKLCVVGVLGAGILIGVDSYHNIVFSSLARTGDSQEIETLTGRLTIWEVVIDLWSRHPLLGYGYGSAVEILPYDPRLFSAAAHTHSMYLDPLFWGGIVGVSLFFVSFIFTGKECIMAGSGETAIFVFFAFLGLTEPPITGLVNYLVLAFYFVVVGAAQKRVAYTTRHSTCANDVESPIHRISADVSRLI